MRTKWKQKYIKPFSPSTHSSRLAPISNRNEWMHLSSHWGYHVNCRFIQKQLDYIPHSYICTCPAYTYTKRGSVVAHEMNLEILDTTKIALKYFDPHRSDIINDTIIHRFHVLIFRRTFQPLPSIRDEAE